MKKILSLLISIMFLGNIQAHAKDIEVLPTINSRSAAQDRVWVGTFQLVWNDFMDKIVYNPIRFREGTPNSVMELNQQSFTINDISNNSYYKYTGKIKKNTKRQISKGLRRTLKESSDIINKLDLEPRNDKYIIYAMLKKDFEFINAFDKLGNSAFNDVPAEYFGINNDSNKQLLGRGVQVLFYNDPSDYAVKLLTTGSDEVILYKNSTNKAFNLLYTDLCIKQKKFKGEQTFKKVDELKIPNINFFEEKIFDEMINKRIMGTNIVISQAIESIKFNMNNKGVKIKSEAGLTAEVTSLLPPEELVPRLFYFDDTFVIFIKENKKNKPYFALRIDDITKFQK